MDSFYFSLLNIISSSLLQGVKLFFPMGNQLNVDYLSSLAIESIMQPRSVPSENYIYSLPPTPLHSLVPNSCQDSLPYDISAGAHKGNCLYLLDLIMDTILVSGASNSHLPHFGTRASMYQYTIQMQAEFKDGKGEREPVFSSTSNSYISFLKIEISFQSFLIMKVMKYSI